ncbi:MAG: tetratricopeptide repeat protein [Pyrinomonadaceae bacterium]
MSEKKNLLLVMAFVVATAVTGFAQASVSGKVEIKKADGTTEPAVNIEVVCLRTDIPAGCREVTTNGKGEFTFIGIPQTAIILLSVSGPGIAPTFYPDIKPGASGIVIIVEPGEGQKFSEEQVRQAAANWAANKGELTEDQKKELAEQEKKVAEVKARNEKILQKNDVIQKSLDDGLKAFNAKDYGAAIVAWKQGVDADPNFLGSAPVLLNNLGTVYRTRAVNTYNDAVKSKDKAKIDEAKIAAKSDLSESLKSYGSAYKILSGAAATDIKDPAKHKENIANSLDGGRDTIRIMETINQVDDSQNDTAKVIVAAYVDSQTDKAKKTAALESLAKYLMYAYDYESAAEVFKQLYAIDNKNMDVLGNLGIALYSAGDAQGSINYLDIYMKNAPKDHPMHDGVEEIVKDLTKQKLKPQKIN